MVWTSQVPTVHPTGDLQFSFFCCHHSRHSFSSHNVTGLRGHSGDKEGQVRLLWWPVQCGAETRCARPSGANRRRLFKINFISWMQFGLFCCGSVESYRFSASGTFRNWISVERSPTAFSPLYRAPFIRLVVGERMLGAFFCLMHLHAAATGKSGNFPIRRRANTHTHTCFRA